MSREDGLDGVPSIRIEPWCVFCGKQTDHVGMVSYDSPRVQGGYARLGVRFPVHPWCLRLRRAVSVGYGLCWGMGTALAIGWGWSALAGRGKPGWDLPVVVAGLAVVAGVVHGLWRGMKLYYRRYFEKIHTYYVLHENIGEADKSWRYRR